MNSANYIRTILICNIVMAFISLLKYIVSVVMNTKVLLYLKSIDEVVWKHRLDFFLWFLFVVIAGQLGTIINLINRCVFDGWVLSQSLLADSASGNFYTFALVLVTSTIGNIFIKLTRKSEHDHRKAIVFFVALCLFLMLFDAVFFSFATQDYAAEYKKVAAANISFDWWQFAFFLFAILAAIISFGFERIDCHKEYNYLDEENKTVTRLVNKEQQPVTQTPEGIALE